MVSGSKILSTFFHLIIQIHEKIKITYLGDFVGWQSRHVNVAA